MLFNSLEFLLFLPIVFCLYWFIFQKILFVQNLLLLISSYVFYGWWDYRFLSLIFISSLVDYFIGLRIYHSSNSASKKFYLWISIIFNLGLLAFFKYFNFFIDSWVDLINAFGYSYKSLWTLNVILPVGISFYTFQTMSYSLDIYNGKLKPTKDFISFASFVSFFPQLVAGPIERASNLLPQILNNRSFKYDQGVQGLRLILYGMFKKVVVADTLAPHVDTIFQNYASLNGGVLLLGLFYFSFQIYCDFSGYSDIAIGISKLFGFELMSNFKFPYFSKDIGEFWRRWHISLSSWFRDYLYIPLGGSKKGKWTSIKNIFIIFVVSGFWHGARWTFIVWGLVHASLYIPLFLKGKNNQYNDINVRKSSWFSNIKEFVQIGITFFSIMFAWVFFRSESIKDALSYLFLMITNFEYPNSEFYLVVFLILFLFLEFIFFKYSIENFKIKNSYVRIVVYFILIQLIFYFSSSGNNIEFIYFQF
jgi:alginate O-acetyltransferase complex protein AlgI